MDLRDYYRKLREVEAGLPSRDVLVVSSQTPDGGREGVSTEVSRGLAAKLITEGKARLATADEEAEYQGAILEAKRQAEQLSAAGKIQLAVMSEGELRSLRSTAKTQKP